MNHQFAIKTFMIIFMSIFWVVHCYSQKRQPAKYTFYSEIIPYLYFPEKGAGDGFQIGLARSLGVGQYKVLFTYGMNKYTYQLSGEFGVEVGGSKVFVKKTDDNIFTPATDRVEFVPDPSLYELLENTGFKHFKPDDGAFTTNYGTIEVLREHALGEKWKLDWGFGGQIGLMNRNELAGAVVTDLRYLSGNQVLTNITFRLSAKYLYYGITNRITLSRKITDKFSVGSTGGVHLLMGKNSVDMVKPYLSAVAIFQIN